MFVRACTEKTPLTRPSQRKSPNMPFENMQRQFPLPSQTILFCVCVTDKRTDTETNVLIDAASSKEAEEQALRNYLGSTLGQDLQSLQRMWVRNGVLSAKVVSAEEPIPDDDSPRFQAFVGKNFFINLGLGMLVWALIAMVLSWIGVFDWFSGSS